MGGMKFESLKTVHVSHGTRCMTPLRLACFRLSIGLFILVLSTVTTRDLRFWTFFTQWCFSLEAVYFLLTGLLSLCAHLQNDDGEREASKVEKGAWVLYQINFAMAFLVCAIVWTLLFPPSFQENGWDSFFFSFYNLTAHNGNVVFMLLEAFLNRLVFCRPHLLFAAAYGIVYLVFSWFLYLAIGRFNYFFLER